MEDFDLNEPSSYQKVIEIEEGKFAPKIFDTYLVYRHEKDKNSYLFSSDDHPTFMIAEEPIDLFTESEAISILKNYIIDTTKKYAEKLGIPLGYIEEESEKITVVYL